MQLYSVGKTSDQHIGPSRHANHQQALNWIAEDAREQNISLLLGGGDLLDRTAREEDFSTIGKFLAKLEAPFICLKGNHGTDRALEVIGRMVNRQGQRVQIISKPEILEPVPGFTVYAIPHLDKGFLQASQDYVGTVQSQKDFLQAIKDLMAAFALDSRERGGAKTLLGHFTIQGARVSSGQELNDPGLPQGFSVPLDSILNFQIASASIGHIHLSQFMAKTPFPVYYIGDPTRHDFSETEPKGYWIEDYNLETGELVALRWRENPYCPILITEEWTWLPAGEWQRVKTNADPLTDLSKAEGRIKATYDEGHKPDFEELKKRAKATFAQFTLDPQLIPSTKIRAIEVAQAPTPHAKLQAYWTAQEAPPEERQPCILEKLAIATGEQHG